MAGKRRTQERRTKTISISLQDRGQTTQDFAVGIGIFLLAIAFVFSYMPSLLTPFSSSVDSGQTAQADRIVATMVDNLSEDPDRPNHLNGSAFEERYGDADDGTELAAALGLRVANGHPIDKANVSIERLNQSDDRSERRIDDLSGGDDYGGESAASAGRIVTVETDDPDINYACEPACRLVVRVWNT
ncbi:hypothetical protein OB955_03400 [Halobacteria archaeon AArc-m2/3/4]|uniref:Flagellin N-terminal-like domain-containing protein n=1 Tax=Natronoglomus mannanivorans TaxID=2979990 RepID=A0ABT2QA37_9EURY|nr:hypothetical protein [Halobacteria archaeon AArc-m2/3/4]